MRDRSLLMDIPQLIYIMHLYLHFVNGMGIVALPFKFCTILFGMSILLNISKFVGFVNKTDFYLNIEEFFCIKPILFLPMKTK